MLEAATPLAKEDPECAAVVLDAARARGRDDPRPAPRSPASAATRPAFARSSPHRDGEEAIEGSASSGRGRPPRRTSTVSASRRRGIKHEPRGILVDKGLRTTNKRVFAIGDVARAACNSPTSANYHAGLVIRNALFRLPVARQRRTRAARDLHRPGAGACRPDRGAGARAPHADPRCCAGPIHENDRAQAERETSGHIKVVTTDRRPHSRRDHRRRGGRAN